MHRYLVIGLLAFQGMLAFAVVAAPGSLGLPPVVVAWMAVLNIGVGIALNQLNRFQESPPNVPHG